MTTPVYQDELNTAKKTSADIEKLKTSVVDDEHHCLTTQEKASSSAFMASCWQAICPNTFKPVPSTLGGSFVRFMAKLTFFEGDSTPEMSRNLAMNACEYLVDNIEKTMGKDVYYAPIVLERIQGVEKKYVISTFVQKDPRNSDPTLSVRGVATLSDPQKA